MFVILSPPVEIEMKKFHGIKKNEPTRFPFLERSPLLPLFPFTKTTQRTQPMADAKTLVRDTARDAAL